MNPSASDWIPKFLNHFGKEKLITPYNSENEFYCAMRTTGFVYGVSAAANVKEKVSSLQLTKEEFTKVNLFHTLLFTYTSLHEEEDISMAIPAMVSFYKKLEKGKSGFFKKLSLTNSPTANLERILSARLQETNSSLKKNSTTLLTYALLYIDVFAFKNWLKTPSSVKQFAQDFENTVISCCILALKSKKKKKKYDNLLIELFESSSEYLSEASSSKLPSVKAMGTLSALTYLEKKYLIDICAIAVWDDREMDEDEFDFLQQLVNTMGLQLEVLSESLQALKDFSEKHTQHITLFEYSNPVKQFYKQNASTVKLLILRNKNRLILELEESGELLVLLTHSTVRDLSPEEKNKVKEQLLDICKTIPSLTIFLLPGGAVLLPLLVKFIPKLLPSAFNENRIDNKKP
ncbi:LETM1-related biofilm-associated protein [Constantimarinum furrinae]|uniref:Letm1 RBD domain-containing protein n=1 Tax=Constantimarinum furrinae TaxID=2562285 RepID=A0A7G8PVU5_9FLAO|nr:LETM1-related biofilm-associated protein [Constantimarinum furrinae]QNJ98461.1 hypothetical protein ALE3EI_1914 [Constantimarinum furrinae]